MKIAITGHSKGIGKAIAEHYSDHTVLGFSRSNGYDITNNADTNNIVRESIDADVFVNNAYSGLSQLDLFEKIYTRWRGCEDKTIVNVVSRTIYNPPNKKEYTLHKKTFRKRLVEVMMDPDKRCRIININPGYVSTDMTASVQDQFKMMSPAQIAEIVDWCLQQPQHIEIGEISMWTTTLD